LTIDEIKQLETYYEKEYGKPKDDNDAIEILQRVYRNKVRHSISTIEIRQGIAEYYRVLATKGLPAFVWMLEAIHSLAKKNPNKQTFPYMIGMIRQWMIHGFGHMPSQEEDEVTNYFLEITCLPEASVNAKRIIKNLMGTYGIVKLTRSIGELNDGMSLDLSLLFAEQLKNALEGKYASAKADVVVCNPVSIGEIVNYKQEQRTTNAEVAEPEQNESGRVYVSQQVRNSSIYREGLIKESIILEDMIRSQGGSMKFVQLQRATEETVQWGSNPYGKMGTLLKHNDNIYKKKYGVYAVK
jgi:hypothetical protein